MIPVAPAPTPARFNALVREPGLRAIDEMVGRTPKFRRKKGKPFKQVANRKQDIPVHAYPTYWTEVLDDLMAAYDGICAYSCFRIHPVTGGRSVDHFAAKSKSWKFAYEWSNYRLCCSRMNARKREFGDVLDPFVVKRGWFQLELVGFQVVPNPKLRRAKRRQIENTIERLGLNEFRREREHDAERYWRREISLQVLREDSPFVAYELCRQERLNPGDVW